MIPLLAASEKGPGQTESVFERKLEMWWRLSPKSVILTLLERKTLEGDSPVKETDMEYFKRVGLPGLEV